MKTIIQGHANRFWSRIAQPRVTRAGFFVIYILHTIGGLGILVAQPMIVTNVIGHFLTMVWAAFLTLGGMVGVFAILPGWNYLERIGLTALAFGILILSAVVIALSQSAYSLALFALVSGWLIVFALRAWDIRGPSVMPPTTTSP